MEEKKVKGTEVVIEDNDKGFEEAVSSFENPTSVEKKKKKKSGLIALVISLLCAVVLVGAILLVVLVPKGQEEQPEFTDGASIKTEDQIKNELKTWIKEEKESGDRDRWKRASDIEDRWNKGKLSCPDFTYVNSEGVTVFVESITDYPKSVIEAKMEMAREFNGAFEGIKK